MTTSAQRAFIAAVAQAQATAEAATAARDLVRARPRAGGQDAQLARPKGPSSTELLPEELSVVALLALPTAGWAEVDVL